MMVANKLEEQIMILRSTVTEKLKFESEKKLGGNYKEQVQPTIRPAVQLCLRNYMTTKH